MFRDFIYQLLAIGHKLYLEVVMIVANRIIPLFPPLAKGDEGGFVGGEKA
jgi:hypothetical protein